MMSTSIQTKQFFNQLKTEVKNDNVSNGAAALAYYLLLAIFPAAIFFLTLLPYLPIQNLYGAIMDLLSQALPEEAAKMFSGVVEQVTSNKQGGLLSFGLLLTFWAASNGMYAIMQQLNITYKVKEGRSFFKVRGVALLLTFLFGLFILGAMVLVVSGGAIEAWLTSKVGGNEILSLAFAAARWVIIALGLLLGFAFIYYLGPDVEQKFRWISPGSAAAVVLLAAVSLGFKLYVANFGKYNATYGSIGAVIVLMLWLYFTGWVILLGSEINAVHEHRSPGGKNLGEKKQKQVA
jgi:membrane protein